METEGHEWVPDLDDLAGDIIGDAISAATFGGGKQVATLVLGIESERSILREVRSYVQAQAVLTETVIDEVAEVKELIRNQDRRLAALAASIETLRAGPRRAAYLHVQEAAFLEGDRLEATLDQARNRFVDALAVEVAPRGRLKLRLSLAFVARLLDEPDLARMHAVKAVNLAVSEFADGLHGPRYQLAGRNQKKANAKQYYKRAIAYDSCAWAFSGRRQHVEWDDLLAGLMAVALVGDRLSAQEIDDWDRLQLELKEFREALLSAADIQRNTERRFPMARWHDPVSSVKIDRLIRRVDDALVHVTKVDGNESTVN